MSADIEQLVQKYENGQMTRRSLIASLSAMVVGASRATAQAVNPPIAARSLNHIEFEVPNPQRSIEFYEKLFGLRHRGTFLPLGPGPEYLTFVDAKARQGAGAQARFAHFCLGIENYDPQRTMKTLADLGLPLSRMVNDPKNPRVYFKDPDGFEIQLQDKAWGGADVGNVPK